jgi:putative PIN family toxin of toxin-antitoxin system
MRYHPSMSATVVIDTSVWIAALLGPSGPARGVIRHCLRGNCRTAMGNALFFEYEAVMSRPSFREQCLLRPEEQAALFADFLSVCRWVEIYYLWRPNLPDEGDNHLIELAVAAGAEWIVTQNVRDFALPELTFPARTVTPAQWLKEIHT